MADAHANLAVTTVATAPSPATSGTTLVVAAGDGAKFPAAPFNATISPDPTGLTPVQVAAASEIVRVTARSTDTLTITRAQEGTASRTVIVGDVMANTVTAKTLTDVETVAAAAYTAGGTDVAVTDGGTGSSTAAGARTNLGLGTLATQSGTFSGTSSGTNTGDQTSVSGNAGTATALATGRTIDGQTFDGTTNVTVVAPGTHAATTKATPADADEVPLVDSAASNVLKKLTWANLKATVKTYTDTLYQAVGAAAAGDLTGTYPNPTLTAAGPGATGPLGGATVAPIVTIDAKGRVTALTSTTITGVAPGGAAGGSLAGTFPNPRIAAGKLQNTLSASLVTGALAESMTRWSVANNGSLLSTGRLSSVAIPVLNGTVCTNMSFVSATTASNVPTNWWFALTDSSFNVIRQTTDQLTGAWAANTLITKALDSIPVTAGARSASATVTLTIPTLSESLTSLVANGDSIVVSNANIAAYNGTFTVVSVSSTQITYVSGGSATDSLAAPFPTVQLASGKRVYTAAADGVLYGVIMVKATTPPTLGCSAASLSGINSLTPILASSGDTSLTGTCPSPVAHATGSGLVPWAAIS